MKPLNVELLMGHSSGVSDSYWRPTEKEVLDDYLKAVDHLTIINKGGVEERQQLHQQQEEVKELRASFEKQKQRVEETRASFENWKKYVYRLVELNTGVALKSEQDVKEFLQFLKEEEKK